MWKGKKRKQIQDEEQTNVYIRKQPKERSAHTPQVLQRKNKKLKSDLFPKGEPVKVEHVERKLKQKEEEQTKFYIGKHVEKPKPKRKKRKQIWEEDEEEQITIQIGDAIKKRKGDEEEQTTIQIGDAIKKRKEDEEEQTTIQIQIGDAIKKGKEDEEEQTTIQIQIGDAIKKRKGDEEEQTTIQIAIKKRKEDEEEQTTIQIGDAIKKKRTEDEEEQTTIQIGDAIKKKSTEHEEEQTTIQIGDAIKKRKQTWEQTIFQIDESINTILQIGDAINLSDLLFTNTRDYLVKYNDNQQVKDKQLAGKVVVLLFVSLTNGHRYWKILLPELLDLYDKLEPKGGFEVVFVAFEDGIPCCDTRVSTSTYSTPHGRFEECFSTMPWTAIPFSDMKSRKRLQNFFGVFSHSHFDVDPRIFVIDPRGMVVQSNAIHIFLRYGAAGFPFTKERLECLDAEDNPWLECLDSEDNVAEMPLSVEALLASPERDYLITNKGEQVPVHELEDKVVGLLFYTDFLKECLPYKLKMVYEDLSKKGKDFEVVLINVLPISSVTFEDAFWKTFEAMPWLAIPFKDTYSSKKLLRIFENILCDPGPDPVSKLVIIGPHGKFIEPLGAEVMMCYGISAYPFTRFSAVKLKIKSIKDVKLEMLWNLDSIFRQQNGSQVQFSQIVGKRIIVLYKCYEDRASEHSLNKLKALYIQMKGTDDEFEVIHIHEGWELGCVAAGVPWLTHPPFDTASNAGQVLTRLFGGNCDGLVAFDRDGTIVRMTPLPAIGENVFPFYEFEDDMEDEVLQLVDYNFLGVSLEVLSCCW